MTIRLLTDAEIENINGGREVVRKDLDAIVLTKDGLTLRETRDDLTFREVTSIYLAHDNLEIVTISR